MKKPTATQCHAMTTYYVDAYSKLNSKAPIVNRNSARYRWESILMDYSTSSLKDLVDYFLQNFDNDLTWFFYNYEKVESRRQEEQISEQSSQRRRQETAIRLEDWKKRCNRS